MWDARVQTLEQQLKSARAEVRSLKKSRMGASETSDSNSDTVSGGLIFLKADLSEGDLSVG